MASRASTQPYCATAGRLPQRVRLAVRKRSSQPRAEGRVRAGCAAAAPRGARDISRVRKSASKRTPNHPLARTCKCAQNMHHQHRSPPSSCSAAQHSTAAHMPCALSCEHHGCASRCITARRRVRHDRAASGAAMDRRGQTSKTRRLELFWGSYSSIGHARWMETERGGRPRGAQVVVLTRAAM